MKKLIAILLCLTGAYSNAASKKWKAHYKIVLSDIKSVEKLRTKDLGLRIRLFELYGEKLTLLLEKESEFRLEFLEKGKSKQLKNILAKQKKTLVRLEGIAGKIEKQTKKRAVLTKIHYYRSLSYYLVKNYKSFYIYLKKAEKLNRDNKLRETINMKLADYHFNEKEYNKSSFYYKKLIQSKSKNRWLTRFYFNLSWSELKLNKFDLALKHIKLAFKYDKKVGYFKIGDQLIDSVLLFYAYSEKTRSGLEFLRRNKLSTFKNLLQYMHYIFENGKKSSLSLVFSEIELKPLKTDEELQLLTRRILVYRTLRKFSLLQRMLAKFKKKIKTMKIRKADKAHSKALILSLKSYSGYLQELVRSRRLVSKKKKESYIRYIAYNFKVLRAINPRESLGYYFYEGETYFSVHQYRKASSTYSVGISVFQKTKAKSSKFLMRAFDSLFKSLEKQKKVSSSALLFAYSSYVHFYPRGEKSIQVYQRMINSYKALGKEKGMLKALIKYSKNYPGKIKNQRVIYKELINIHIDNKNISGLQAVQARMNKGFLSFPLSESRKVSKIISEIYLSRYESIANKGRYTEAISGFGKLYENESARRSLRVDALRKKMFYQNKMHLLTKLAIDLEKALSFFNKNEKLKYKDEMFFYIQNICVGDFQKGCLSLIEKIRENKLLKLSRTLKNLYFRLLTVHEKNIDSIYEIAQTQEERNYMFKLLLIENSDFTSKLYRVFYKERSKRDVIDAEVEKRVVYTFYSTFNFASVKKLISKISIPSLRKKELNKIAQLERSIENISFKFPDSPRSDELNEKEFMAFGEIFDTSVSSIFKEVDATLSRALPNYLPYILSRIIRNLDKQAMIFKNFIPVSKNVNLENAMTEAVTNFQKLFDMKLIDYRSLYFKSLDKTIRWSGVQVYANGGMLQPLVRGVGNIELWQE